MEYGGVHLEGSRDNERKLEKILEGLEAEKALLKHHVDTVKAKSEKFGKEEVETAVKTLDQLEVKIANTKKILKEIDEKRKRENKVPSRANIEPVYYGDYLGLDKLLTSQTLESDKWGHKAHDEMLFIIVHQAFELWFKQILHEFEDIIQILHQDYIPEKQMGRVLHNLERVVSIQRLLLEQITVLETMTPLDFMDFRDFLFPASGFQSFQFRLVENRLGLKAEKRVEYNRQSYHTLLSAEHKDIVEKSEKEPTLFDGIQKWLERTPFLKLQDYDFLDSYKKAADAMFDADKQVIMRTTHESGNPEERAKELERVENNKKSFHALFDEQLHNEQIAGGARRLSFKATQAALLLFLYQSEPLFQIPFRIIQKLIDIDENFTAWRHKHAMMVIRMIGTKVGTGGSSGYWYLKATIERGRVFGDFASLATYLLPRSEIPPLPHQLKQQVSFHREAS